MDRAASRSRHRADSGDPSTPDCGACGGPHTPSDRRTGRGDSVVRIARSHSGGWPRVAGRGHGSGRRGPRAAHRTQTLHHTLSPSQLWSGLFSWRRRASRARELLVERSGLAHRAGARDDWCRAGVDLATSLRRRDAHPVARCRRAYHRRRSVTWRRLVRGTLLVRGAVSVPTGDRAVAARRGGPLAHEGLGRRGVAGKRLRERVRSAFPGHRIHRLGDFRLPTAPRRVELLQTGPNCRGSRLRN